MPVDKKVIMRWFGCPLQRLAFKSANRKITGYVCAKPVDLELATKQVLANQEAAAKLGYKIFCGYMDEVEEILVFTQRSTTGMFALSGVSESDIVKICKVGTPSEYIDANGFRKLIEAYPDGALAKSYRAGQFTMQQIDALYPPVSKAARRVQDALDRIYERFPFRIYFADSKGLKATFQKQIGLRDASWVARSVLKINTYVINAVEPLSMEEYIVKHQELRLLWD